MILTNPAGIEIKHAYSIATAERAFLDMLYVHKDYYFDNLHPLNWDAVFQLLPIYGPSKRLEQLVHKLHKEAQHDT